MSDVTLRYKCFEYTPKGGRTVQLGMKLLDVEGRSLPVDVGRDLTFEISNPLPTPMFEVGEEYTIRVEREWPMGVKEVVRRLNRSAIMQYFAYEHLPTKLQDVSRPVGELAELMDADLPACEEKQVGLRKLLEAKDCFVRASSLE